MDITIGTWNISECVALQWDVRKGISSDPQSDEIMKNCDEIVRMINENNIDIMCFQEFPIKVSSCDTIVEYIKKNTMLQYSYGVDTYPSFLMKNAEIGIIVFSRYKLLSSAFSFFKNPDIYKVSESGKIYRSFDKGLIKAEFLCGNDSLTVITGHAVSFSPFDTKAEDYPESFAEIINCIKSVDTKKNNVIVAGDFNTEKLFDILPELNNYVEDKLPGSTTVCGNMEGENFKQGRKLDYFMVSPSVKVNEINKLVNFSDHYFCICKCTF